MTGESAALPSLLDGCPHTVTCGRHAASPTRRFRFRVTIQSAEKHVNFSDVSTAFSGRRRPVLRSPKASRLTTSNGLPRQHKVVSPPVVSLWMPMVDVATVIYDTEELTLGDSVG